MRHFFIITNETKDENLYYSKYIEAYLLQADSTCTVKLEYASPKELCMHSKEDWIPKETECILVLGGDGTLLQAARDTIASQIPLIGINLGTLGYLAEVEVKQLEQALLRLLNDEYVIEKRMMLHGVLTCGNQIIEDQALNDVVLTRRGDFQIMEYDIYVNDHLLNSFQADGIIISTPTGSTGYNLSAGGPVAEPSAQVLLLTPICPHTMNTRSIILSPEDEITIVIPDGKKQTIGAYFDGSGSFTMTNKDRITVKRSKQVTQIIKLNQESFLKVLHKKMQAD